MRLWMGGPAYILARAHERPAQAKQREGIVLTMADIQPNNSNRMVMYLSAAVVVLLIAFVAVVIIMSGGSKTAQEPGTTPSAVTTSTSQAGMAPSTSGFDPATATKVPAGTDPKKYVTTYYQAILDKKWDAAFKMQPAKSQVGQSVQAFQETQEQMYGMTKFEVASSEIGSTEATVAVAQTLKEPNGVWTAVWTFVKDGGDWLVKARAVNMGAPAK